MSYYVGAYRRLQNHEQLRCAHLLTLVDLTCQGTNPCDCLPAYGLHPAAEWGLGAQRWSWPRDPLWRPSCSVSLQGVL